MKILWTGPWAQRWLGKIYVALSQILGMPVYISTDKSMITPQLFIVTAPQETAVLRAGLPSSCPIVRQQALNGI